MGKFLTQLSARNKNRIRQPSIKSTLKQKNINIKLRDPWKEEFLYFLYDSIYSKKWESSDYFCELFRQEDYLPTLSLSQHHYQFEFHVKSIYYYYPLSDFNKGRTDLNEIW